MHKIPLTVREISESITGGILEFFWCSDRQCDNDSYTKTIGPRFSLTKLSNKKLNSRHVEGNINSLQTC